MLRGGRPVMKQQKGIDVEPHGVPEGQAARTFLWLHRWLQEERSVGRACASSRCGSSPCATSAKPAEAHDLRMRTPWPSSEEGRGGVFVFSSCASFLRVSCAVESKDAIPEFKRSFRHCD